jgi:hypothetical protein
VTIRRIKDFLNKTKAMEIRKKKEKEGHKESSFLSRQTNPTLSTYPAARGGPCAARPGQGGCREELSL